MLTSWVFFVFLSESQNNLSVITSILFLVASLPLFGTNTTAILERILKNKFVALERIAVISLFAFTLPPLIITLLYSSVGIIFPHLSIVLTCLSFVLAQLFNPFFLENGAVRINNYSQPFILSLFLSSIVYFVLVLAITNAYYPLPDLDSYYWYKEIQDQSKAGIITNIALHRPLFSSLTYIFHVGAGIDLYVYFKYVLPFTFLLGLIPTSLLASQFQGVIQKITIHLFPLSSASFVLYSLMPIPQSIFNTGLIYFICFTLYSWLTRRIVFYLLAGLLSLIMIFYHELSIFIFLPWIAVAVFSSRSTIYKILKSHKVVSLLLLIIAFQQESLAIHEIVRFIQSWTEKIVGLFLHPSMNLTFPVSYINIDGNAVGWGNWFGSVKYYAFYAGPITILSILFLVILALKMNSLKKTIVTIINHAEILTSASLFAIFFLMAEIFPRFFNVALFPERAWGLAAIFILPLVLLINKASSNKFRNVVGILFIAGILVNISAALYINSQKKYLITPSQIQSAEWIKNNLPSNRLILSSRDHLNLIRVHSQSEFSELPDSDLLLKSESGSTETKTPPFNTETHSGSKNTSSYLASFVELSESFERLREIPIDNPAIQKAAMDVQMKNTLLLASIQEYNNRKSREEALHLHKIRPVFIYYAEASTRNPYINRPYVKKHLPERDALIFDQHPERFERVYTAGDDEVIIWKVVQ